MRFESGEVKVHGLKGHHALARWTGQWGKRREHRRGEVRKIRGESLEAVAACSLTGGAGWASIPGWSFPDNLISIRQTAIQPECALTGLA